MSYTVARQIGIDAGHRIMTHGSKCRHVHGHRYTIEAVAEAGRLQEAGEQTDMAVDFGFLKDEMMAVIDVPCDHGFIASADDRELLAMFAPMDMDPAAWLEEVGREVAETGWLATTRTRLSTKLYVVPFQPTAECLARHWFQRLQGPVADRSDGHARLKIVRVWETPNCWAEYSA